MRKTLWLLLAVLTAVVPTSAAAEPFFDLFAGAAFTDSNDVDLSVPGFSTTAKSDFKTSFSVGGRAGYWFGPLGLNLDVNYFRPEFDPDDSSSGGVTVKTDLDVVGIGLNVMLRGQFIKTTTIPSGALQPYIFAGPTLFISTLDFDVSGLASGGDKDTDTSLGFTAGAGLTYMFTPNIGIFGEYRFTYNRPEFDINGVKIEPKLNSHHILAGVTFRF
jgi:opacity protein-like surface antigen